MHAHWTVWHSSGHHGNLGVWIVSVRHHARDIYDGADTLQAWPWSPDTLAMATWVAAESGEPDALTTLTQASRGLLAPQLAGGLPASLTDGRQPSQEGFAAFSSGQGVPSVKAEPASAWPQSTGPSNPLPFPTGSDGLTMAGQPSVPELAAFDLGAGMEDFDAALPLEALDSPAAPSF